MIILLYYQGVFLIKLPELLFSLRAKYEKSSMFVSIQRAFIFLIPAFTIGAMALALQYFPVVFVREFISTALDGHLYGLLSVIYSATYEFAALYLVIAISYYESGAQKTQCNHVRMFSVLTSVVCYFAFLGADVFSGTFDLLQYTRMVNIFPAMGVSLVSTHLFFAFFNHKDHRFSSAFSSAIDAFLPMLLCLLIFAVTAEFISLLPGISNFHELMLFLIKKPFELRQHRTTTIKQISDTK